MAFKSIEQYNEERFGNFFLLRNDGDFADVIFLYRSTADMLVADTHYIKTADYSGYVHCCGRNCPACANGIRVQTKLFIPLYNIQDQEIQFWDRSIRFEIQFLNDVFANCPNPSEYVFRVTRRGVSGDPNTRYEIVAYRKNGAMPYDTILATAKVSMPDHYNVICKEFSSFELASMLNSNKAQTSSNQVNSGIDALPDYPIIPRGASMTDNDNTTISASQVMPINNFTPSSEEVDYDIDPIDEDDVNF